ncbi:hypothetical protein O4G98_02995 [Zoogloeaceae bacterium G21618-S1]|nr:hypothetical protein [Zoogloeaceae bacterium G21618-S1]
MALGHIMLILTLLADGQLSAAFVSTANQAECETRATAIGAILKSGGANVQQIQCLQGSQQFARFSHAAASTAPRHAYELTVIDGILTATPITALADCTAVKTESAANQHYCVSSTQTLVTDTAAK